MKLMPKTLALLGLALLLGLLNLLPEGQRSVRELPTLAAIPAESVTRLEITKGQLDKVVMEGSLDEGFRVLQPFSAEADLMTVRPLLRLFKEGIPMDLQIDEGNLEDYGVDHQQGILVEIFTGPETPAISFVVGGDMPGGSSFVRLPDSEVVYRAKVGGRTRYDRDAADWRNRLISEWEVGVISAVDLVHGDEHLRFSRDPSGTVRADGVTELGDWQLDGKPGFALDQESVTTLARALGTLRAGRVLSSDYDAGWDPPASRVALQTTSGESLSLSFGRDCFDGACYVRTAPDGPVYLVAQNNQALTLQSLQDFRDRSLFSFRRENVLTMSLTDEEGRRVLRQLPDGMWEVAEPRNVDADVKQIFFTVNTLAELRAAGIVEGPSAEQAGLDEPTSVFEIALNSGELLRLEIGSSFVDPQGRLHHYARRNGDSTIYALRDTNLAHIRKGFGRAD